MHRYSNKLFKGFAKEEKVTTGWCHGFKLHLACNDKGEIIFFVLTGDNVDNCDPKVCALLAGKLYGKLFADRGYISKKLFESFE
ncbi:MAG: transposase [Prevotella sp.]|nr:transposase [Prevotella sp.]